MAPETSIATMNLRIRFPPWSWCSALAPKDAAPAHFFPNLPQRPKAPPPRGTTAGTARASLLGGRETRRWQGTPRSAKGTVGFAARTSSNRRRATPAFAGRRSRPVHRGRHGAAVREGGSALYRDADRSDGGRDPALRGAGVHRAARALFARNLGRVRSVRRGLRYRPHGGGRRGFCDRDEEARRPGQLGPRSTKPADSAGGVGFGGR